MFAQKQKQILLTLFLTAFSQASHLQLNKSSATANLDFFFSFPSVVWEKDGHQRGMEEEEWADPEREASWQGVTSAGRQPHTPHE